MFLLSSFSRSRTFTFLGLLLWNVARIRGFNLCWVSQSSPTSQTQLHVASSLRFKEGIDLLETNLAGVSPPFPKIQTTEPLSTAPPVEAPPSRSSTVVGVEQLQSSADLINFMMGGANNNELVVVKYYAHYCKICQRAGMQFKKIATEYPDVGFGKVESLVLPDSANTLRSLGVSKFPFVQIYRKGKCVASFSTGPSHVFVKKVRDTIDSCLKRSPEEWNDFLSEFATEIESNRQAREALLLL